MNNVYCKLTAVLAIAMLSDISMAVFGQGEPVEGFTLMLQFDKSEFQQGEPVSGTVMLSNTLAETRPLSLRSWIIEDIVVLDPYRNILPRTPDSPYDHRREASLGPHGALITEFQLNDFVSGFSEPGEYIVTVSCPVSARGTETYRTVTHKNLPGLELRVPNGFKETKIQSASQIIRIVATSEVSQARTAALESFNPDAENRIANIGGITKPNQVFARTYQGGTGSPMAPKESRVPLLADSHSGTATFSTFTPIQKARIAVIAGLLALLLAVLWRASRRKRES